MGLYYCGQTAHRIVQSHRRKNDFAEYKITVAMLVCTYIITDRSEAPADSNEYQEV